MRILAVLLAITSIGGPLRAAPPESVRNQFRTDDDSRYTIEWGREQSFDPSAKLEIGSGNGHGRGLRWLRFTPDHQGVEVLSIQLVPDGKRYDSAWPADRVSVTVKRAELKPKTYAALLHDVAIVDAAKLTPAENDLGLGSTHDFWVYARLNVNRKALVDLEWAGYESSLDEPKYAKPRAAVALAQEAVEALDFKEHTLTDANRAWASEKFARDWKRFKDEKFHWWVRERYVIMSGVLADASALPTLREILSGDPKDRCVYFAINAVTRLAKKDVRPSPVEEMDVEATRNKVLELIRDAK